MSPAKTPGVDSARRVLQVLMLFSGDEPSLSVDQIARRTEIPTQSVYRYISLLREMGLASEHSHGRYALSPRTLALGRAAEHAYADSATMHEGLERLAKSTSETALVMRQLGDSAVCSDLVETTKAVKLSFTLGHLMPLHRGAGAKVLLAWTSRDWAERYLRRSQPDVTQAQLHERLFELQSIREQRWAESRGEVDEGIWACAAPITNGDRLIASITVAGPQFRIGSAEAARIRTAVSQASRELSKLP